MRILDDRPELWPYILASIFIHVLFFFLIPKAISPARFEEKPIEVFAVEEVPEENKIPYRIADIAKPEVEERPKDAKFLGLYDSTVLHEQVGISKGLGVAGAPPKLRTRIGDQAPKQKVRASKSDATEISRSEERHNRLLAFNKDIFDDKKNKLDEESSGSKPMGGMDDFYPDFRRGAHTYLNVLRYPGVEYFVRMKRAFKIAFNPEPSLREYFSRNLVTRGSIDVVLGVSVGRSGNLSELFVFRSSGVPAYDEEALRTVRASSPFSSPPEKFLDADDTLRMSWTFSVYL